MDIVLRLKYIHSLDKLLKVVQYCLLVVSSIMEFLLKILFAILKNDESLLPMFDDLVDLDYVGRIERF